jgi:UDP-3-O-[3-hydroxymyristoyl] N-acetylglucosamine deacetylase/3-hydroxyacyl-[acyl-carrier-protein] dehydratase
MSNCKVLKQQVTIEGVGLHTGAVTKSIIKPSQHGSGIRFCRVDIDPEKFIQADVNHVAYTKRGTTLTFNDLSIATIEHFMSALYALDIQDADILCDGPEMPILDGSAKPIVDALIAAGIVDDEENSKEDLIIKEPFVFKDEVSGAEYILTPHDGLEITTILDFDDDVLGEMTASIRNIKDYHSQISSARTFVYLSDIEKLYDAGLIKGGDLDNAVVIADKTYVPAEIRNLAIKLNKTDVDLGEQGMLNTSPLRYHNEPARHKILDLLGDMALIGRRVKAKIIARKPGHTGNIALAKALKVLFSEQRKKAGIPVYNPNTEPIMNLEDIKSYLPHRYPFLLVDKVIELSPTHIVGVKNVTSNEAFFQGHFPGNPIFPGVLQMEALAQTGGLLALSTVEDKGAWDTYFLKMDNVKFKAKVVPGDTIILKMELLAPIRRGIVQMAAHAFVGDRLVSEGELTAQIVKRS